MSKHRDELTVLPNLDNLEIMAKFLRDLEPEKFDFRHIVTEHKLSPSLCGTKCCAIGWMPAIWPDQFMWYNLDRKNIDPLGTLVRRRDDPDGDSTRLFNFNLAEAFFGISESQSDSFFMPHAKDAKSITPIELAEQIESFIAEYSSKEQTVNASTLV